MSAKVSTFGQGVTYVATGESGTQANEFEAAIKSVTSSITVGAVFLYDTRNDSDSGAWRNKARGSWYYETLNTATRGGRRSFPSVALIVADNDSSDRNISIYDLDDPSMVLWAKFEASGGLASDSKLLSGDTDCNAVFALNGRIYTAHDNTQGRGGLRVINFVDDECVLHNTNATYGRFNGTISQRNSELAYRADTGVNHIANEQANDVAATVLEGAEIGALNLPIPTVAVACAAGTSVIHANGDVYNVDGGGGGKYHKNVAWDDDNTLFMQLSSNSTHTNLRVERKLLGQLYADSALANDSFVLNLTNSGWTATGAALGLSQTAFSNAGKNKFAQGGPSGLHLWKRAVGFDALNNAEPPNLNAYITSTYNTGYMLGDIRGAFLMGDRTADRSVKGNTLALNQASGSDTVNGDFITNSETAYYSNFSATNYLSKAHTSDFDFGTGDFSIMLWAKWTATDPAVSQHFVDRGTAGSGRFVFYDPSSNGKPRLYVYGGGSDEDITTTASYDDGNWHQLVGVRRGGKLAIYVDGKDANTTHANSTHDLDNGSASLYVGASFASSGPLNGSLSLLRISATAPTPQQVKEIYEAEKPLFRSGAKCLLQGGDNEVKALSFDKSTELLTAGTGTGTTTSSGATIFRGLEVVDTFKGQDYSTWNSGSIGHVSTAGGVSAYNRPFGSSAADGGVIVDLPAIDVRGDINTADTKLPDDGKIHFSGVTTSNGGDVIGHIPIGENENVTVKAHVTAKGYGSNLGTHYANYVLTEQFYRAAGGDVTSAVAEASIVSQESAAGLDATLSVDTSADTAKITVTGDASDRIVWTASVEVIRDAEKSYER